MKKIHNSVVKTYHILIKQKFLKTDDLLLLFLPQKILILGIVLNGPLFVRIALKKQFSRSFTNFFSELLDSNTSH